MGWRKVEFDSSSKNKLTELNLINEFQLRFLKSHPTFDVSGATLFQFDKGNLESIIYFSPNSFNAPSLEELADSVGAIDCESPLDSKLSMMAGDKNFWVKSS